MTLYVLNSASPGAPTLSGTNGSLCTVLDWALNTIAGWQIEYTATNARIYRPQYGNRFRLYVNHDSAISGDARLATIRGCENASAASNAGLVDPFPLASQIADGLSNWIVSSTANATARAYWLLIDNGSVSGRAWVKFFVNVTGAAGLWDRGRWGDFDKRFSSDLYSCEVEVRNTATASIVSPWSNYASNNTTAASNVFIARSIDGTVKSTRGALVSQSANIGQFVNAPSYGDGYLSKLDRTSFPLMDTGSTTTTFSDKGLMCRGWIPNAWNPIVPGSSGLVALDTIQDGAYDPGSNFLVVTQSAASSSCELLEITDTWHRT